MPNWQQNRAGLAILVLFGMTTFLLPTFANIFQQLAAKLPALTIFMLACSEFFRSPAKFGSLIAAILGVKIALVAYYKTPAGRLPIDSLLLKLPLIGELLSKAAVARFCSTFGMLTGAGVPLLSSFEIVAETAGNQAIANAILHAKTDIEQGGSLTFALFYSTQSDICQALFAPPSAQFRFLRRQLFPETGKAPPATLDRPASPPNSGAAQRSRLASSAPESDSVPAR